MDKFYLYDQLTEGHKKESELAMTKEAAATGRWRGGSSGCILNDTCVIGADPRQVVLRFLGVQIPKTYDEQLMLDAGYANEDMMLQYLDANKTTYKCEEDIPMVYTLAGTDELVTGRPDIILGDTEEGEFVPKLGVEAKLICSPHKAHSLSSWGKAEPSTDHVIQAAHYASFFDIPYVLAYTCRVWNMLPGYVCKFPDKHLTDPEHRAISFPNGKFFMAKPFQTFYDLRWDKGVLLVDDVKTKVTVDGIHKFYKYCSDCIKNKEIPKLRSGSTDFMGQPTKKNKVLEYYDFKDADNETDFDAWVEACREIARRV